MKARNKGLITCFAVLSLLWVAAPAFALQTVNLVDGASTFVDISTKDLNLIRFSSPGIKVFTNSKILDIKIDGENVFVAYPEGALPVPQEVFLVTSRGTYSLVLVPKGIPAETIVVRGQQDDTAEAAQWESSHDYITGLKDIIKFMYIGVPPGGYKSFEINKDVTRWDGTKELLSIRYEGATLVGEVHRFLNLSTAGMTVLEKEFYQSGVLAVSIAKHDLRPLEETEVYLVKRSETQEKIDAIVKSANPLDVLRAKQ